MIEGKVARILNARELVINRGEADGVKAGMRFDVLDPKAENIKDPDSGEVLGSVNRPKVRVEVTRVEDRLSVARTYRSWSENIGGSAGYGLSNLFLPAKYVRVYETLKTDESTWENLDESQSYVKTGDPVREVLRVEETEGAAEEETEPRAPTGG